MNKLLLLFCFFFCAISSAQDAVAVAEKKAVHYTKKDVKVDNSVVITPKFHSKLKEKYSDKEFQYEVKVAEKGLWDRFTEWLSYWFKRLFGLSDKVSGNAVINNALID